MGEMSMMGNKGDVRVTWDARNPTEVTLAKEQFESGIKRNMLAYRVRANGDRGERIREFDPDAERIILAPQMAGGC